MLKVSLLILFLAWAVPVSCAESNSGGFLMPEGIRAIATPDDSAIIVVSDPTSGAGKGVQWIGVAGAIACNADNSIIVWSGDFAPPAPLAPPAAPNPAPSANTYQSSNTPASLLAALSGGRLGARWLYRETLCMGSSAGRWPFGSRRLPARSCGLCWPC